jgi:hypothetical protein
VSYGERALCCGCGCPLHVCGSQVYHAWDVLFCQSCRRPPITRDSAHQRMWGKPNNSLCDGRSPVIGASVTFVCARTYRKSPSNCCEKKHHPRLYGCAARLCAGTFLCPVGYRPCGGRRGVHGTLNDTQRGDGRGDGDRHNASWLSFSQLERRGHVRVEDNVTRGAYEVNFRAKHRAADATLLSAFTTTEVRSGSLLRRGGVLLCALQQA